MAERPTILQADWVLTAPGQPALQKAAILVTQGRIRAIGPVDTIAVPEGADILSLGPTVLMPGFVNAHQHGRGISQLLMGYADRALEPWIAGRRRHAAPDIRAITRLAAEAMLANGVTATLHANYTYGTGDYPRELRAQIAAYRESGLRTTLCIGLQDRGHLVYPDTDEAAFKATLPQPARSLVSSTGVAPYMTDWPASRALMDQITSDYAHDTLLQFAWGPAGPQWVSDTLWQAASRDAVERGVGLHFHLLESSAQAQAARRLYPNGTLAHLQRLGVFDAPASCAHGVQMTLQDMQIAADAGLVVVLNPGSNLRLFNGVPPVSALRGAGVQLAVGTDNCALGDNEDYLQELRLASVLGRVDREGSSMAEAATTFAMGTSAGAAAAFMAKDAGRLAVGAPADISGFSLATLGPHVLHNPCRLAELFFARAVGRDCRLTMVAGQIRFADRAEDRARLDHALTEAATSVAARETRATEEQIEALQNALRKYYSARSGA